MFRMFSKDQPRVVTQQPWSYGINQVQPQKTAIMQQPQGSDCLNKPQLKRSVADPNALALMSLEQPQLKRSVADFAAFSMVHEFSWR